MTRSQRSRFKSLGGKRAWEEARSLALQRAMFRCEKCGGGGAMEVHHRLPLETGGTHDQGNLQVLCREAHIDTHLPSKTRKFRQSAAQREWQQLVQEVFS